MRPIWKNPLFDQHNCIWLSQHIKIIWDCKSCITCSYASAVSSYSAYMMQIDFKWTCEIVHLSLHDLSIFVSVDEENCHCSNTELQQFLIVFQLNFIFKGKFKNSSILIFSFHRQCANIFNIASINNLHGNNIVRRIMILIDNSHSI